MKQAPVWIQRSLVIALVGFGLWLLLARSAVELIAGEPVPAPQGAAAGVGLFVMIAVLLLGWLVERERARSSRSAQALAREAGLAAKTSEALRSLVVHAKGFVRVADVDDRLVIVCPLAEREFGLDAAGACGRPARAVLPAPLADLLLGGPADASWSGAAASCVQTLQTLGGPRAFRVETGSIRSHAGSLQGRFVFARDLADEEATGGRGEAGRPISQRIHDDIGQPIALVQIQIERCLQQLLQRRPVDLVPCLRAAARQLEIAATHARTIVAEDDPKSLGQRGLVAAVRQHVAELRPLFSEGRLAFSAEPTAEAARWPGVVEREVFDILREALSNAIRHARARTIQVRIEGDARQLAVSVADDGHGIGDAATPPPPGRIGLASMHERAASIGARLTIDGARLPGTTVAVVWEAQRDGTHLHH